jgi:hypothetical protein
MHPKDAYRVESLKELEIIINHFEKYPLVTAKLSDFLIFMNTIVFMKSLSRENI